MSATTNGTRVDPGPFFGWWDDQLRRMANDYDSPQPALLERCFGEVDSAARRLYRWRHGESQPTVDQLEDALERGGARLGDVYPELELDVELELERFCARCHELVTPIDGVCPWCESELTDATGRERAYCPACDTMSSPGDPGGCWRCGSSHTSVPWEPCACGCEQLAHRFDPHGRRVRYVRGHAPRSLERDSDVAAAPFRAYLQMRLAQLDPIAAVAREHGIARADVVAVLQGHSDSVSRTLVRRALWIFANNGKGMPKRPDAVGFFDLYPDDARAKICPGCGKGKAPAAELCKACRKKAQRRGRQRAVA